MLVFEADEEGGDLGIEWLAEHHWDKLDAAYSLNEGGIMSTDDTGDVDLAAVTVRDKISFSVVLHTRGVSSHSSRPQPPSAIDRLARALSRIRRHQSTPELSSLTRRYFRALADAGDGRQAADLRRLARARGAARSSGSARRVIRRSEFGPLLSALMRTTFTNTIVERRVPLERDPGRRRGDRQHAPAARASRASRPYGELRRIIDDPAVRSSSAATTSRPAEVFESVRERQGSPPPRLETDLYAALEREILAQHGGAVVTPALYEAATDAGPWRERGIPVYGLRPYRASATDLENMHGVDERVSITGLNEGADMVERILRAVATG